MLSIYNGTRSPVHEIKVYETLQPECARAARDQLYLAVRVALGQKILEGSPGFFIMDDAFLSADENRLQIQTDLLKQLSNRGWQIIYFTMKKKALETIRGITDNKPMILAQLAKSLIPKSIGIASIKVIICARSPRNIL